MYTFDFVKDKHRRLIENFSQTLCTILVTPVWLKSFKNLFINFQDHYSFKLSLSKDVEQTLYSN
jgi:hypothetical protein